MARPIKVGIDYFSLDVSPDPKVEYIESTFEAEGYYFWIKLLQRIYSLGFYIEWNKYQAAAMKKATGISVAKIEEILAACLEVGLFSQELFDRYSIITSRGIQKRFYIAAAKRTQVEINPDYVLNDELLKWYHGDNSEETEVNFEETEVNSEETRQEIPNEDGFSGNNSEETTLDEELSPDNGNQSAGDSGKNSEESTQSKVKQSKVKQSKVKQSKEKKNKPRAPKPPKVKFADHVQMTQGEYQKLVDLHGESAVTWMIEKLDDFKGSKGRTYKDDYRAIRSWVVNAYKDSLAKGYITAEGSESNDSNESDYAGRDWSTY